MSDNLLSPDELRTLREVVRKIGDPGQGLPDAVFEFALAVTPMVNVDLLVLDDERRFILAWRADRWGEGWHVPGGIIRMNEPISRRIEMVARSELGVRVRPTRKPADVTSFFAERGHFVSLLYPCVVVEDAWDPPPIPLGATPSPGALKWFDEPPSAAYPSHRDYVRSIPERIDPALRRLGEEAI